eukprot:3913379-Heterocapsa_arctica.AAC.1
MGGGFSAHTQPWSAIHHRWGPQPKALAQIWLGPLVIVQTKPTCRTSDPGSYLDYFGIHPILEFVIRPEVDLISEALTFPHWPVVMHLQVAGVEEM